MLCDQVLGNVADPAWAGGTPEGTDYLDLHWTECNKRALRKTSRGGRTLRILLPLGVTPRHGDVLWADPTARVVVNLVPTEVLVARPRTLARMGALALEVGNLHAPAQVTDDGELLVPADGPAEAALERLEIPYGVELRRFVPAVVPGAPVVSPAGGVAPVIRPAARAS